MLDQLIVPQWSAPSNIRAVFTTRYSGVSLAPYDSLNLAQHVGDDAKLVQQNRLLIEQYLQAQSYYLTQTHSTICADLDDQQQRQYYQINAADACLTSTKHLACSVMVADCLPVLFTSADGAIVATAHAGWRGLVNGVLEHTIAKIRHKQQQLGQLSPILAWLGPCIGKTAFEVGSEVRQQFLDQARRQDVGQTEQCFVVGSADKYLADLVALAKIRLVGSQVEQIFGNDGSLVWCTYSQKKFFSYRREQQQFGATGRMAGYILKL